MSDAPVASESASGTGAPPRWLLVTLAVIAAAALAFAVGRFSTFGASAAAAPPQTDSAEAGFARDMQVHHAQAIEMAMTLYRKTEDPTLRVMAYDMATAQSSQRGEMFGWLVQWGLPQQGGTLMSWMSGADAAHGGHDMPAVSDDTSTDTSTNASTDADLRAAMGMATDDQLRALDAATGTAADCLFTELMITHHEGAIEMVDAVLDLGTEPRVRAVAQSMAEVQQGEIDGMRSVQSRLRCAA